MQYAVIKSGGKQYKVSAGDSLTLDRLNLDGKKTITFDEVLLVVNDGVATIGKPNVNGAKVEATLIEDKQGEKIRVMRFKAKSRYRRTIGFRAQQSVVKIDKIDFGSGKSSEKTKEPTKSNEKTK